MSRTLSAGLAAALLLAASPAFAHAFLSSANPAVGSTVKPAPSQIICDFTEALEPHFSSIQVQDSAGHRVDAGDMHLAADNAKRMLLGLKPLAPGSYTVTWHATSVDTHRTDGHFSFTVAP